MLGPRECPEVGEQLNHDPWGLRDNWGEQDGNICWQIKQNLQK